MNNKSRYRDIEIIEYPVMKDDKHVNVIFEQIKYIAKLLFYISVGLIGFNVISDFLDKNF